MTLDTSIKAHYAHGRLVQDITDALAKVGKTPQTVTVDDLAPVDEFHIGGREATEAFVGQLDLSPDHHVLEFGGGLGGAARFVADRRGCRVSGIDLTADYVETARTLSEWVGLGDRLTFHHGSAVATPFDDGSFDAAFMLHVGMNIPDKDALCAEAARVLKAGGTFGIYDVMVTGDADRMAYPVPWAAAPETNAAATPDTYKAALQAGGFEIVAERNRRDFAIAFFDALRARMAQAGGPPPLGLHIVMGENTPAKVANMVANIKEGCVAPVEIIARRAA